MQQNQLDIECRLEIDWHAQDGRKDDWCMTEDHRDDKANEDNVQSRVISWTCNLPAKNQV